MTDKSSLARRLGDYGEKVVKGYLSAKGYEVIAEGYRAFGKEVDIIARHGGYTVFIEVKYRRGLNYGRPIEAVDQKKLQNIIECALGYMQEHGKPDDDMRIDILEVFGKEFLDINHVENVSI